MAADRLRPRGAAAQNRQISFGFNKAPAILKHKFVKSG